MAASFGKFRFRRAQLTVGTNFASTVSGNFVIGYSENPDIQLASAGSADLANQVYNLDGKSCPFWAPVRYPARFRDRSKWYNIDNDSDEVMNTTQGKFIVAIQQLPTASLPLTIPMLLDYEIEFTEPALQAKSALNLGALVTNTGLTLTQRDTETRGQYHVSTGTALPEGIIYKIVGGLEIQTVDGSVDASFVVHYTNAALSHGFYNTYSDAAKAANWIVANIQVGGSFSTGAFQIQPATLA